MTAREQETQLLSLLSSVMDTNAFGRIMNIRLANPEAFGQLAAFIIRSAQSGQLKGKVTDEQLKALASRVSAAKPHAGKITIQRK